MKRFTTILCSLAFMFGGIMIATSDGGGGPSLPGTMTANATPTFDYGIPARNNSPFGFSQNQIINDTVYVTKTDTVVVTGRDTVWVPRKEVKYIKVPVTKYVQKTDTLYVPSSSLNNGTVREEQTVEEISKTDSSKNDNHSTVSHKHNPCVCDCLRDNGLVH